MNMKKWIALALAGVMATAMLTGCGEKKDVATDSKNAETLTKALQRILCG